MAPRLLDLARETRPSAPPELGPVRPSPAKKARILYAEDDSEIRGLVAGFLNRAGYAVTSRADGLGAWETLRSGEFDLVITDYDMPWLTGIQLAAKARAAGLRLPIILASGSLQTIEAEAYRGLDRLALLAKPFALQEMLDSVSLALLGARDTRPPGAVGVAP